MGKPLYLWCKSCQHDTTTRVFESDAWCLAHGQLTARQMEIVDSNSECSHLSFSSQVTGASDYALRILDRLGGDGVVTSADLEFDCFDREGYLDDVNDQDLEGFDLC